MLSRIMKCAFLTIGVLMSLSSAVFAARIVSVTICESVAGDTWVPINIRESFTTQTPEIHAVAQLDGAKAGTIVKCAWVAIDAIATPNYEIAAMEQECYKEGEATAHFSLTRPDNGWPPGNYKLDIYIDGQLATIKTFSIAAGGAPPQAPQPQPQPQQQQQYQPPPQQQQQPQTRPQPQSSYGCSGTYVFSSQGVVLTLEFNHQPSGELTGSLTSNSGVKYKIEGVVENDVGYGACYDDQGGVFFESYPTDDQMYFAIIEPDANNMPDYSTMQEFMFDKQPSGTTASPPPQPAPMQQQPTQAQPPPSPAGGQSGISGAQGSAPQAASPIQSASGRAGKTFSHPAGFTFWYPDTWTAAMQEGFLQLTPPNPGKVADGPTELYFIGGESIAGEGITSPDDPRVVSYIDQQVKVLAPVLQYSGRSTPINMSQGKGALLEWTGKGANGEEIVAHAFVSLINDFGVTLTGIGHKKQVDSRDGDLRQMFASFAFGQSKNDPALIGSWELLSTVSITNQSVWESDWSRAQAVSETSSNLTFQPNGTWVRNDKSHMLVGSGGIWLEDKSDKSSNGTWNAGDGILYMLWEDNSYRECQYKVEQSGRGPQLKLVCGDKGEVWQRQ